MKFNDKVYDFLKWICIVVLPALAAAYGALANVWGLSFSAEIVTTLNILATFLGALIAISNVEYKKDGGSK